MFLGNPVAPETLVVHNFLATIFRYLIFEKSNNSKNSNATSYEANKII